MKGARVKLAILGASAVVVALFAAAVAFNLFIGWKIESDAINDIEYLFSLNDDAVNTGRTPNYFLVDSAYRIDASDRHLANDDEEALAAWFSSHPKTGVVNRITVTAGPVMLRLNQQATTKRMTASPLMDITPNQEITADGMTNPRAIPVITSPTSILPPNKRS